jgi:putative redox protein
MPIKVVTKWVEGMTFDTEVNGHHFFMDADPEWGGLNKGPRPKPLLLSALSGCSGMDVVSILDKMKINGYQFRMEVEADSTDEHPVIYKDIKLKFFFEGENLPQDKVMKAVRLSTEQYCGVNAMLKKSSDVTAIVYINGEEVKQ